MCDVATRLSFGHMFLFFVSPNLGAFNRIMCALRLGLGEMRTRTGGRQLGLSGRGQSRQIYLFE